MSNVVVALEEEYGYRYWVWETGMDEADLIQWMKDQKEDDTFLFLNLPGKLKKSSIGEFRYLSKKGWQGMFHQVDDSHLISPNGEQHHTGGWEPIMPY